MASSPPSRLTELQRDLVEGFSRREKRLFLSGGAALAGYYFGHRTTEDLDLFSAGPGIDLADAPRTMEDAATETATAYAKGCDAGHAGACEYLAGLVESGRGVPRDEARAAALYAKACSGGDATACKRGAGSSCETKCAQLRAEGSLKANMTTAECVAALCGAH